MKSKTLSKITSWKVNHQENTRPTRDRQLGLMWMQIFNFAYKGLWGKDRNLVSNKSLKNVFLLKPIKKCLENWVNRSSFPSALYWNFSSPNSLRPGRLFAWWRLDSFFECIFCLQHKPFYKVWSWTKQKKNSRLSHSKSNWSAFKLSVFGYSNYRMCKFKIHWENINEPFVPQASVSAKLNRIHQANEWLHRK